MKSKRVIGESRCILVHYKKKDSNEKRDRYESMKLFIIPTYKRHYPPHLSFDERSYTKDLN